MVSRFRFLAPLLLTLTVGCGSLNKAIVAHNLVEVKSRIVEGADVNVQKDGAPIRVAASANDVAIMRELIAARADLDAADCDGETALHIAAANGYLDIARLLLRAGAKVDAHMLAYRKISYNCCAEDSNGHTPLTLAVASNQPDMVRILLENGADRTLSVIYVDAGNGMISSRLVAAICKGADRVSFGMGEREVGMREEIKGTAYDIAVAKNEEQIIELLK
jgi:ankyrin repeat protein